MDDFGSRAREANYVLKKRHIVADNGIQREGLEEKQVGLRRCLHWGMNTK